MARDINILIGDWTERDKDVIFGPIEPQDEFFEFEKSTRWPQIMLDVGLFSSKGNARKNGWDKNVQSGFSMFSFGKLKHLVTVWKII